MARQAPHEISRVGQPVGRVYSAEEWRWKRFDSQGSYFSKKAQAWLDLINNYGTANSWLPNRFHGVLGESLFVRFIGVDSAVAKRKETLLNRSQLWKNTIKSGGLR